MPANAIELLIALFLVHFLLDFPLQPSRWVADRFRKHAYSVGLYLHALAHGAATFLCFWAFATDLEISVAIGTVVLIAHFLTDLAKSFFPRESLKAFFIDQVAHWLLLLGVWTFYAGHSQLIGLLEPLASAKVLLLLLAYTVILLPVSIIVSLSLKPWIDDINKIRDDGESLAKAGATIGYLERILVLTFILVENYTAIGFVLALKTAFRFKDTEDRRRAEYMMMGTFLSFTLTIGVGLFVNSILGKL